tara:strand:+ start:180 stop:383 length:204 start_codon:yes stop_codon:yes gene_type:complete
MDPKNSQCSEEETQTNIPQTAVIPQYGHIDNVFSWYKKQGKDESGYIPVIIKPDPEETKHKRKLNSI